MTVFSMAQDNVVTIHVETKVNGKKVKTLEGVYKQCKFLEDGEYLVTKDSPDSAKYEIFFEGKKLSDVTAIIRRGDAQSVMK